MSIIRKLKSHFVRWRARRSSDAFCDYLRNAGVVVGHGTHIDADSCLFDLTRPSLITIGADCYFNRNFTLLTHDWVSQVFINCGKDFINSSGKVVIGNNVSFGQDVMVLKGVTIGDNCFIGARSVVSRDIPANSIAVGCPAKVIMSLDEYYQKRLGNSEKEAMEYAKSIQERFHRKPEISDFWEEFPLFVSGNQVDSYPEIPIKRQVGEKNFQRYCQEHKAKFKSLNDFLNAAGIE